MSEEWFDYDETDKKVKAVGQGQIVIGVQQPDGGFTPATTPITLNELIHYIHLSGSCVSRHLNAAEIKELSE
jgi:hypothetical protein